MMFQEFAFEVQAHAAGRNAVGVLTRDQVEINLKKVSKKHMDASDENVDSGNTMNGSL